MNDVLMRLRAIEDELVKQRKQRNYELNNLDEDNIPRLRAYSQLISENQAAVSEVKQEVIDTQATVTLLSQYTDMSDVVVVESSDDKSKWNTSKVYYDSKAKTYFYHDGSKWNTTTSPITAKLDTSIAQIKATADNASASIETIVSNIGSDGSVTAASIVAKINAAGSAVQISADHISLKGKTIALTTDSINITSTYFNVATSGAVSCTSLAVTGNNSSINILGNTQNTALIKASYYSDLNTYSYFSPYLIYVNNASYYGNTQMYAQGFTTSGYESGYFFSTNISNTTFSVNNGYTGNTVISASALLPGWLGSDQVIIGGNLAVYGTKPRVEQTKHYGDRLMYAFESPSPLYSDFGRASIADDGLCYVFLDPVFYECIDNNYDYFVFIQPENSKEFAVIERNNDHFVVRGEPRSSFSWMLVTAQKGYSATRTEELVFPEPEPPQTPDPENAVYDSVGDEIMKEFENQLG